MRRVATSLVLIPAVSWVIFFAPYALFWCVVVLFAVLCYSEYLGLVKAHGFDPLSIAGYGAGLLLLAELPRYTTWLPVIVALAGMALALRSEDPGKALGTSGAFVLGVFYIFGSWSSALTLRQNSPHWLFFAIALNWAGDISAYYIGRAVGKRKLSPRISPGKSWEGAAASVIASSVFGVLYLGWALPEIPPWLRGALAIAGNVAGQFGDLAESAIKRGAGVKDSGHMLPGHGGWLDRLDSSLFSMPVIAALQSLIRSS